MSKSQFIESADLARELLSRSEVLSVVGRAIRAFAAWIGEEAYTPASGEPPYVAPARRGTWSGLIVVHHNRPVTWVLLRSDSVLDEQETPRQRELTRPIDEDEMYFVDEPPPSSWR